jgi:AAA family ATP:ADP antiporter
VYTSGRLWFNGRLKALSMLDFLRRAFPLQRNDLSRGALLVAYLFFIICAYTVARLARDALFLGQFPASLLPYADITVFLLVGVAVAAYIRAGERVGIRRALIGSLLIFGLSGLAFAGLDNWMNPAWLSPFFYVWVGIFGVLAPAQGWTLANYVVAPREAKRLFGLVAAGTSLGNMFGALLTRAVTERVGADSLPILMAVLVFVAAVVAENLWRRRPAGLADLESKAEQERPSMSLRKSLRVVVDSPYLRAIAGIIGLASLATYLIGWQFKALVQQFILGTAGAGGARDALASFLGTFEAAASVGCVFIQILLTAGILRRSGLRTVLFALPIALFAGSLGLVAFAGAVFVISVPRAIDRVIRYSINTPAVELLYLPVPLSVKLPAKSVIDTVVWRVGDAGLGGLTVLAFVTLGGLTALQLTWVTLPLIGLWIAAAAVAYRRYVGTLEESVRKHRLDIERAGAPVLDRSTTDVLADRLEAVDPKEILYALDIMVAGPNPAAHPAVRGLLDHEAPEVRKRALELLAAAGDEGVAAKVEDLLRDPSLEVRTEALLYLARHADVDPLTRVQDLGDYTDASIRAAVIAVLARLGRDREETARILFEGMAAEDGPEGQPVRREAASLAERLPVVFEEPLKQLIGDEDTEVARAAIRAARSHGGVSFVEPLLARLGDAQLRDEARDALVGIGPALLEPLGRALAAPGSSPEIRQVLPDLLERIGGNEAARLLADRLLEGHAELRLRALRALGRMREQRPNLEVDPWVLETVLGAEILGHYRSYQILGALELSTIEKEPTTRGLRVAMLEELERIFLLLGLLYPGTDFRAAWEALRSGNPVLHDQAIDLLESRLRPSMRTLLVPLIDPEVPGTERMRLSERLAGTPVDNPVEAVKALAVTGDPWLRACAAYAIGAQGLHELEGYLLEWQDDDDPLLRESVRQAREALAGRRARPIDPARRGL